MPEAQKSDFEKYWHKRKGSGGKLNIYMCVCV